MEQARQGSATPTHAVRAAIGLLPIGLGHGKLAISLAVDARNWRQVML
jgi:hypothetical protein